MQTYFTENPWPVGLVSGTLLLIFVVLFLRSGEVRTLVAALVALAALVGLWSLRGRLAKAGMYSFGAPPSAEEEEGAPPSAEDDDDEA